MDGPGVVQIEKPEDPGRDLIRIVQETQLGQHSVFFCAIEATRLQPDEMPLVHFNRAFCGIAALG